MKVLTRCHVILAATLLAVSSPAAPVVTVHQLPGAAGSVGDVAWGNGRFVAIGSNLMIYSSSDGATWTTGLISAAAGFSLNPNADLYSVAYGNGWWVALGANVADEVMLRSTDGQTWIASNPELTEPIGMSFTNGQFVAGDNDRGIYTSTDGSIWTRHSLGFTSSTGRPLTAVYGNGVWAVPGTGGVMFRSPDLATLQGPVFATISASPFTSVSFQNGIFLALDEYINGHIRVSTDAQNWRLITGVMPTSHRGYGCAWGSAGYVVCTNRSGFGSEGWLMASDDGYKWSRLANVGIPMYAIAQGNGTYVAGASNGRVVRLIQNESSIRQQRDGSLLCYWPVQAGAVYDVQHATNPSAWTNLSQASSPTPGIEVQVTPAGPRRYYRLKRR